MISNRLGVACRTSMWMWMTTGLALTLMPVGMFAQESSSIRGTVVARAGGEPLAGAAVRVEGLTQWSSALGDGSFTLTVPAGRHTVSVEALGYRTLTLEVEVAPGSTVTLDFPLEPRPLALDGIQVSVLRPDLRPTSTLRGRAVEESNPKDVGELLRAIDGVDAVRRGPLGLDPVVRGLRETEVGTYLDGTRMFPAGPARMDSPLTHLDPSAVRSMEVVKGPYALTWGAGNLSAIRIETQPLPEVETSPRGSLAAGYDSNLQASETTGKVFGRAGNVSYFVHGAWREGDDYKSGDGSVVPGTFDSWDIRGKLGFDVGDGSDLVLSAGYQEQGPIDYPGRLLTADSFESLNLAATYSLSRTTGTLRGFELQAYYNDVDHGMNNEGKPTSMPMEGRMPPFALDITVASTINVMGGRLATDLQLSEAVTAEIGGDVYRTNRDATRRIRRKGMEMVMFEDMMWPDATITDGGAFGRLSWSERATRLAGTLRFDVVSASAPTASDFFLQHLPAGVDLKSSEANLSAAATASFDLEENWTLAFGLGTVVRTADASERYSDRIPASKAQMPAEFMGNPDLEPERSTQGDLWLDGRFEDFALHVGAFARKISDYITIEGTSLPKRLPLSPQTVFRYVNGDASFYGLDASLTAALSELFTLDLRSSYLHGQDNLLNEPVIGVAPMRGSLGLRFEEALGRFYLEGVINGVSEQTRVSTSRGELPTDGYWTGDIRAGFGLANGVTLRGGILNVWDQQYHNHLNAKNPFTGVPVPEPGRVIFIDVAWSF